VATVSFLKNKNKKQILITSSFLCVVKIMADYLLTISSRNGSLSLLITFIERDDLSSNPIATVWLLPCACTAGLGQVLVTCSF